MLNDIKRWMQLKEELHSKQDEVKELQRICDDLQELVWENLYINECVDNITLENQIIFRSLRLYASAHNKSELLYWLSLHNEDYIITEVLNAGTLSSWAKNRMEADKDLPKEVHVYYKPSLQVRKKKN